MKKINQLNSIKGIAIVMIILFHYFGQQNGWKHASEYISTISNISFDWIVGFISSIGYLGVSLFIISSGIGLTYSQLHKKANKNNWKQWYVKRFRSIIPEYWIVLIGLTILPLILRSENKIGIINFITHLTATHIISPKYYNAIDGSWWYISLIISLYIIFPILYKLSNKYSKEKFLGGLFIIAFLGKLIPYLIFNPVNDHWYVGFFISRIFEFGIGIIIAKELLNKKVLFTNKIKSKSILTIMFILSLFTNQQRFIYDMFGTIIMGPILFLLLFTIINSKKAIWDFFGKISYHIYLIHFTLIYKTTEIILSITGQKYIGFIIYLIITTIISYVFYQASIIIRKRITKKRITQ